MGALHGLKVLDCTHVIAGAYCSMILADLGADVVKIEPPSGESTRGMGVDRGAFRAFDFVNRNKRAIALDLSTPAGPKEANSSMPGICHEGASPVGAFRPNLHARQMAL